MRKVQIITDSTCDLINVKEINESNYHNLLNERGVIYLSLSVIINQATYLDSVDITSKELFEIINETNTMPTTSAIAPGVFVKTFKKYIEQDIDVLFISISSQISATYNSAVIASNEFEAGRVFVVDGKALSSGTGITILKACDLRDEGYSAKEIADSINESKTKIVTQFGIDTLKYLYKGGRASGLTFFVAKFLHIKPILKMVDGKLEAGEKIFGKTIKVFEKQFEDFLTQYKAGLVDDNYLFITHCMADEACEYIKGLIIKNNINIKHIYISTAGAVISAHCGPNTLGILYSLK